MKKLSRLSFYLFCVAMFMMLCSNAFAWEKVKLYAEAEGGYSFMKLESGGFNTGGPHLNTGDDKDAKVVPGLRIGATFFDIVRADIAYHYRGKADFTTNSYAPPVPTYFYATEVKDISSLMFSVFAEPFHFKNFTPYVGAGVGSSWMKVTTNDTVQMADSKETKLTWQIEAGLHYAFTKNLGVRVGYRYVNMGEFDVPLTNIGSGGSRGNLTGKLTAHEMMAAFRYTF